MQKSTSRSFTEIGLPNGHGFPELAYHYPTGYIIAHTRPLESRLPAARLSIRRIGESHYSPVGDFPPAISVSSFALSPKLPLLYFITSEWKDYVNGPPGGDWDSLYRFFLDTRCCEVVARRGELVPPNSYQSAWLCEILSVSDDGCNLYCKAALRGVKPIDYCLSEFSTNDRKLSPISKLEAVFA